ncbi:hypothetical protein [Maribacter halichondriae]|uniref:hypothetical protein n=1 Tax=Maribacter halichondriae TaxID=2980554 RepID=UPI0023585022|nr:hypothetical protein [Maribacter sp. Hal144]
MKRQNKLAMLMMVLAIITCYSPSMANTENSTDNIFISVDDIEGSWAYDVQNVDPQYQKGLFHITKENGEYALNIQGEGDSMIPTEELEVNGDEVKFVVYVEGDRVAITLNFDGDTFTGSGSSSSGPFTMSGKRMRIPE